jgi:hypothetical protein
MQVEIKQEDFDLLHPKIKIQFASYIFYNFIDKILCLKFFGDFEPNVKIYQSFKTIQTK